MPFGSGARNALRASQPGRMRMIIDVSFCDGSIRVSTMPPGKRMTGRCVTPVSNFADSYLHIVVRLHLSLRMGLPGFAMWEEKTG